MPLPDLRRKPLLLPPAPCRLPRSIPSHTGGTRLAAGLLTLVTMTALSVAPSRAATPRVHAIVGAKIVVAPGKTIERGTVVIRDGMIAAVGAKVPIPADARIWDADSLTVYPGLIDAFVMPSEPAAAAGAGSRPGGRQQGGRPAQPAQEPQARGPAHEVPAVHPETRVVESLPLSNDQIESLRAAGFAAVQLAPRNGILRGTSAVVGLGQGAPNRNVVAEDAAHVIALDPDRDNYPGSLMGVIAVVRQAMLDARWYREGQAMYAKSPAGKQRPETNVSWESLQSLIDGKRPALFVADEMLEVLRSGSIAREAGIRAEIVGAGDEYKRVKEIASLGAPLVVPVNYPEPPDVSNPDNALEVTTEELRHWNHAPDNPGILAKSGVRFALTANGLKDVRSFRANVGKAIERGLDKNAALAAVTTMPAEMLGLSERLGTIAVGKIANLTVTRGELFSDKGKVREIWVDGDRYEMAKDEGAWAGSWTISWGHASHTLMVAVDKDTTVKLVVGPDTLKARDIRLEPTQLDFTVQRGVEAPERFKLALKNDVIRGTLSVEGVGSHQVTGSRVPDSDKDKRAARDKQKDEPVPTPVVMGNSEAWRMSTPTQPGAVLVKNSTIWTAGPQGILNDVDLLVQGGKIAAVGKNLKAPAKALVIDGTGKHVAPGIIDCHSHSAILGNVNECTHSVTAEVRIQDVINSESVNIYRQLASGNTIMHLLHGSCNAIGGQCAVIKNKWGEPPDKLLFAAAPQTIKFALGENPKQSNFDGARPGPPRYPQSRGGVEDVIRDAFTQALDYRAAWDDYRHGKRPLPPKRDLQKEAVLEILEGKRFVHAHSYRQDEILMLMRVAEEFGVRVQCFQHVLEGYKVADEMAKHGAMGSSFSDWWAYKFEVIDAIPYNGYLMWDRGVTVSYNSDSDELARRLNTEAAKAVKYGGVPPEEAIKFCTINPAKQLRVEDRVGSLEVGKDADFAIWNGSPLSPYSLCEQTWIEGRKYFDRAEDLAGREALAKEREALLAKARGAKKDGGGQIAGNWPPRYLDDADMSGNGCGGEHSDEAFMSESLRRAIQSGEVQK